MIEILTKRQIFPWFRLMLIMLLICFFFGTLFLRVKLYYAFKSVGICSNNLTLNFSNFHVKTRLHQTTNEQSFDETKWYYKSGTDGLWRHLEMGVNSELNGILWKVKWLNRPPENFLGVIVYLASVKDMLNLTVSLLSLRQNLFKPRPVVIFHEGDFNDEKIQLALANTLGSNISLGFEQIRFPTKINITSSLKNIPLGYFHMCKFFAMMLPYHPLISNLFIFYLRLDAHSYLLGPPLNYDLFDYMQINGFQYGFVIAHIDYGPYINDIWNSFQKFLTHTCIQPSSAVKETQVNKLTGLYSMVIVFNNFELSNGSLWRSEPRIDAWLRIVDEYGGIYRHRWGDAPIRTLAVTQFLEQNQVVKFRDIGYAHRREYTCSIRDKLCQVPRQLRRKLTHFYTRGCFPTDNPLCQYYPEKI